MPYRLINGDAVAYIDDEEIMSAEKRREIREVQIAAGDVPVLFCRCWKTGNGIPMKLTKHRDQVPHLYTAHKADYTAHWTYCCHRIPEEGRGGHPYLDSVKKDVETGITTFRIAAKKSSTEKKEEKTEPEEEKSVLTNANRIDRRNLTFRAAIKMLNTEYFKKYQRYVYGRTYSLTGFNASLYGYIKNSARFQEGRKRDEEGKGIDSFRPGRFFYCELLGVEEKYEGSIKLLLEGGRFLIIERRVYNELRAAFEREYSHLPLEKAVSHHGAHVVVFGFSKDRNGSKWVKDLLEGNIFLVNDNGLYSESLYEADVYNIICRHLFGNTLNKRFVFEKPLTPVAGVYKGHDSFVPDGIIAPRKDPEDIRAIEVFGRTDEEYRRRKKEKMESVMCRCTVWDVETGDASYREIEEMMTEYGAGTGMPDPSRQ